MNLKVTRIFNVTETYHIAVPDTFVVGEDDPHPYLASVVARLKHETDHASPIMYEEEWDDLETLVEIEE